MSRRRSFLIMQWWSRLLARWHRRKAARIERKALELRKTYELGGEIGLRVAERAAKTAEKYERKARR